MTKMFKPPASARTRIRRQPYSHYDRETVNAILDSGLLAHIGYVVDGAPYVTPTAYWRGADRLYWHGAAASRLFREGTTRLPVCVAMSRIDGLVLARCGFKHSLLYRSVLAFGHAEQVTDATEKRRVLDRFIDRLYAGRSRELRKISAEELAATSVMAMTIEEATAKIASPQARGVGIGVVDKEADYDHAVWAGVIPIHSVTGAIHADARLLVDPAPPPNIAAYAEGTRVDEALCEMASRL
jgi:nitroimidazol reductase NimA-like FMN-containing flavoprotein (pyridoxamine 5'-phosphate oxidase superfamily)